MSLADRLKSLTDESLGESELDADTPLAGSRTPSQEPLDTLSTPAQPEIDLSLVRAKLSELVSNSRNKELEEKLAWRCSHIHQSNGVMCGEINGLVVGKTEARKTCKKCQQLRSNSKTVEEEILEIILREEGL